MKKWIFIFLCLITVFLYAETEHIKTYISNIHINEDGSMIVNEEITVFAGGDEIRRGIFRDFPLYYTDRAGNGYSVGFEIIEIKKNGEKEPYHTENLRNGIRIYIGSKNVYLHPGYYTYEISYKTTRQLGFFEDHDELYWNVTGNGWTFNINHVKCNVFLPDEILVEDIDFVAYTGKAGKSGMAYEVVERDTSFISFISTERFHSYEGMTIVVSWTKGHVKEPTKSEKAVYFIKDNMHIIIAILGIILLFLYYMWAWVKVGKDPDKGTIIPLYESPENLSPGAIRYIMKMNYDNKIFSALIMNLAVKGYIKIIEEKKKYIIEKLKNVDDSLSKEESIVMNKLLNGQQSIKLNRKNRITIIGTIGELKKSLNKSYKNTFFFLNSIYTVPAIIISILSIVLAFALSPRIDAESMILYIWLSLWTIGLMVMVTSAIKSLRSAASSKEKKKIFSSIFLLIFVLPFLIVEIIVLSLFTQNIPVIFNIILIAMLGLHVLFFDLLKAPTISGRKIMDKIEGFKMYMSTAERDDIEYHNLPPSNIEVYERFLPFAFALDIENKWTNKFQSVINNIAIERGGSYHPVWYVGTRSFSSGNFASSFSSSLSSAVSTSSSSSSSGFSGGSSGGGGGGGGGGGW